DGAEVGVIRGYICLRFVQFRLISDLTGGYFIVLLGFVFAGSSHGEVCLALLHLVTVLDLWLKLGQYSRFSRACQACVALESVRINR
ncbi:MAG: hypothetical protein COA89_16270, partial [Acidithiobacillus sp.]